MLIPLHDNNPIKRWPVVTVGVILINTVSLLGLSRLPPHQQASLAARYGFVPERIKQLSNAKVVEVDLVHGAAVPWPDGAARVETLQPKSGEIFTSLVTCMFLHAGWLHLVGNMWFFWIFGNNIEDRLGHFVFLIFYLVGGIVASAFHWAMTPAAAANIPVIGASGAVAVMLGAYAVTYPSARVKVLLFIVVFVTVVEIPALMVLGIWLVVQLLEGIVGLHLNVSGNVAWWAHIGGFITGAIVMPLLAAGTPKPRENRDEDIR